MKVSTPIDVAAIEATLPPLSSSYGTEALIERGVDAKLGSLANRDLSHGRPSKTRRVDDSQHHGWRRETFTDLDKSKESLLFILTYSSMSLWIEGEKMDEVDGCVLVTTHRLLFIAQNDENKDLAIDAICVTLHAMTSDPEISVYCQLSSNSLRDLSCNLKTAEENEDVENPEDVLGDDPVCSPIEIFFTPQANMNRENDVLNTEKKLKMCEDFFKALGTLVALNPICDNEGEEFDVDSVETPEEVAVGSTEDNFICRLDNYEHQYSDEDALAEDDERKAMLARLDAVLTVPPELDRDLLQEGQFDDADDDDILL